MHLNEKTLESENSLNSLEKILGIEISDDELLNMEPELLLKVQSYLKEYRERNKTKEAATKKEEHSVNLSHTLDDGLIVLKHWRIDEAEVFFEEVESKEGLFLGTRISQDGRTYIAREWKITEEVKEILVLAVELGYQKCWRFGHPQDSYLLGGSNYLKGCHHIGWSKSHSDPWIFVLGAESLKRRGGTQIVKEITFNKHLEPCVAEALKNEGESSYAQPGPIQQGTYRIQNGGGNCITTHPEDFKKILKFISNENID